MNVPSTGYVGVGTVTEQATRVDKFTVEQNGQSVPIADVETHAPDMFDKQDNDEDAEYLVGVKWHKTVTVEQAVKEKGFFGNQNTVCQPTAKKWAYTIERLKKRFGVSE